MPRRSLEEIVKKRLKQYKTERIVLLLLIALGAVLTLAEKECTFMLVSSPLFSKLTQHIPEIL